MPQGMAHRKLSRLILPLPLLRLLGLVGVVGVPSPSLVGITRGMQVQIQSRKVTECKCQKFGKLAECKFRKSRLALHCLHPSPRVMGAGGGGEREPLERDRPDPLKLLARSRPPQPGGRLLPFYCSACWYTLSKTA